MPTPVPCHGLEQSRRDPDATRTPSATSGRPAISLVSERPEALRLCLAAGLPLSQRRLVDSPTPATGVREHFAHATASSVAFDDRIYRIDCLVKMVLRTSQIHGRQQACGECSTHRVPHRHRTVVAWRRPYRQSMRARVALRSSERSAAGSVLRRHARRAVTLPVDPPGALPACTTRASEKR
jgi:hypothetical protein